MSRAAADAGERVPVRGQLFVASDGFVQLCAVILGERCVDGAIVRDIDGIGLMVNVLPHCPGSGYETNRLWLTRVRTASPTTSRGYRASSRCGDVGSRHPQRNERPGRGLAQAPAP